MLLRAQRDGIRIVWATGRDLPHPAKVWKEDPVYLNLLNWSIRFAEGRAERFFECSPLPETHCKKVQRCRQEKFDVSKMVTSLCFSESFFECRSLHHMGDDHNAKDFIWSIAGVGGPF